MVGITVVLVVAIACFSILFGMYMHYCSENGVKMFEYPRYEERISKLEKAVKKLEGKE